MTSAVDEHFQRLEEQIKKAQEEIRSIARIPPNETETLRRLDRAIWVAMNEVRDTTHADVCRSIYTRMLI